MNCTEFIVAHRQQHHLRRSRLWQHSGLGLL